MATITLSNVGQAIGGAIGGPVGATIGRALGALAGSVIDNAIFAETPAQTPAKGYDVRLQSATEGGAIARIYGWNRVSGNIIWATELERIAGHASGAKGSNNNTQTTEETITANFAVGFCEGEVTHIGRIWADGEVLETEGLNIRFYRGSESQLPDSLITAKQGTAPAYRGLCYIVFERLPLAPFGNRIPNISAELCRSAGDLENDVRAITVIPGATEFGYDPQPRVRIVGPGAVAGENTHVAGQVSDWTLSIDALQGMCPKLEHVALVVAWFGDDLRCGSCKVQPRVEAHDRQVKGTDWVVSGLGRNDVPVMSRHGGGPAYGGTPSDSAVLAAIADLKARGLKVTLYPLLLMDVPGDNGLTDPYTQNSGQPAYPWRGRITCDPAPGLAGTPDMSAAIEAGISAFVGAAAPGDFNASGQTIAYSGPVDWGYRRMILHYAHLVQLAGGVETLLIGSEMRGLTRLRRTVDSFPFVEALAELAADVRAIAGAGTKISYAADWSEYSGFQPPDAPGDKLFHLDPLWASPAIDAVGIDNYMPLSDWRDGTGHADAALAASPHDLSYLQANIAGGEGFDWFYASEADRQAGNRTPITDGSHDEPWIWRYKDLVNWWGKAHHNRVGGVRAADPTGWVPGAKPIWFTELGCGAVDKGTNLPSAFGDPKSAENALPHFSSGAPDTLIQRQFLRAHHQYWRPGGAHNPVSPVYGGRMVDPGRLYLWTWDARPFPAFPNLQNVWSDGVNYMTGHWLTGRLGTMGVAEMIAAVADDYGTEVGAGFSGGLNVQGFQIENVMPMRDAIAPLLEAADLSIIDRPSGLSANRIGGGAVAEIATDNCIAGADPVLSRRRPDASTAIGHLGFSYLDRQHAYLAGTVTAIAVAGVGGASVNSGLVIEAAEARQAAERVLARAIVAEDTLEFAVPPSMTALEVGDLIDIKGQRDGPFVITELRDGPYRKVTARAAFSQNVYAVAGDARTENGSVALATGDPYVTAAHLPDGEGGSKLVLGAIALPWPGEVLIAEDQTGAELTQLHQSAILGTLSAALPPSDAALWDRQSVLSVHLHNGHLAAALPGAVLAGSNRAALERDDGGWEVIGFADAELTGEADYHLSQLLRGLEGTGDPSASISAGNRFMLLDGRLAEVAVDPEFIGAGFALTAYAGRNDATGTGFEAQLGIDPLLPLAPVHLRAVRAAASGDVQFTWTRRARRDGNSWVLAEVPLDLKPERYRIEIFEGDVLLRTFDTGSVAATYAAADQIADFGGLPDGFSFTITQISPTYGVGHKARGIFNG